MQPIEDVRTLNGKEVTLSFWYKASAGESLELSIRQVYGTGGSDTVVTEIGSVTAIDSNWTKYYKTFTLPSIDGKLVGTNNHLLLLLRKDNTNFSFHITEIQLESGSEATPFEDREYTIEVMLCTRFYQVAYSVFAGDVTLNGGYRAGVYLTNNMRTTPVITGSSVSAQQFNNVLGSFAVVTGAVLYEFRQAIATGVGEYRSILYLDAEF